MQPYQQATQEIRRQGEIPLQQAKTGASVLGSAATAFLGGGAINRVLPFLSKYVPEELARKGLSRLNPGYGKFIDKAMSAGQSFEQVRDFIGSKIEEEASNMDSPKEDRNIIQQYSPELHEFIGQEIKKGRNPLQAGAIAQYDKRFKGVIDKLSKDHKTPWSNIIESVYGMGQQAKLSPGQSEQQQQQQAPGQGQAALMAILQKIQQSRGVQ